MQIPWTLSLISRTMPLTHMQGKAGKRLGWLQLRSCVRCNVLGAGRALALTACLVATVAGQDPLSIPIGPNGEFEPPPGVRLESTGVIETLAGTGEEGSEGDGGPASAASFGFPRSIAMDSGGNIYVADARNHKIRKIDSSGVVSTFAGTGQRGYRPRNDDGQAATEVRLDYPAGVATDAVGNVYLLDSWNNRIRRIDPSGNISTIAGTGDYGFDGDGGPATEALFHSPAAMAVDSAGTIYVADSWNHRVRKIDPSGIVSTIAGTGTFGFGGDGGPAVQARLAYPAGVGVSAEGDVYVADWWNHRIRRIDASGTISTLAGTGDAGDSGDGGPASLAQLAYPAGVAADMAGNIYVISYVIETANHRIRRIDGSGTISAFAGSVDAGYGGDGDPATEALLDYPTGVFADPEGSVYIADSLNARIRVVRPGLQVTVPLGESGESVALVVSEGGALTRAGAPVLDGTKLPASNGNEYSLTAEPSGAIVATYLPEQQRVSLAGSQVMLTKQEDGTWRIGDEQVENGHRYSYSGREYVLELRDGNWGLAPYVIRTVAGSTDVTDAIPAVEASLHAARGLAVDSLGYVYLAESGNDRIRRIDPSGSVTTVVGTGNWGFGGDGGPASLAQLWNPEDVSTGAFGSVFVADRSNNRVRRIDRSGVITTFAGNGICCYRGDGGLATDAALLPRSLVADVAGNVFVSTSYRVRKIDTSGIITTVAGTGSRGDSGDGGPATQAEMGYSLDVAVDRAGNLYIADIENHRVRRVDTFGRISTVAGVGRQGYSGDGGPATNAELSRPSGLAVSQSGTVYIADTNNRRVRRVDASGAITTVGGTGDYGSTGDGGPATEARLANPTAVEIDRSGSLYVIESGSRVRKIDASGTITTIAGTGRFLDGMDGDLIRAESAKFQQPRSVALDRSGNVLFGDSSRIWKADPSGTITVFAGTGSCCHSGDGGPATQARLQGPEGLAVDTAGNVYATTSGRVRKIDTSGIITTIAGTGSWGYGGDGGPATEAQFRSPRGVAVDWMGNVYVADGNNHRIRKIDSLGSITTIAGTGERGESGDGGPATEARLWYPGGVAVDGAGNVYVAQGRRVRRIATSGTISTLAEFQRGNMNSVALDRSGNLFVGGPNRIHRLALRDGTPEIIAGTGEPGYLGDHAPSRSARLSVTGLVVGRWGSVWFADPEGRRIRVLEPQAAGN